MIFNTYQLGILWGCGSYNGERIVIRHKNRYFLDQIQPIVGNQIYRQNGRTVEQYVLKFRYDIAELEAIGYTRRNDSIRILPECADIYFLQAYLELHGSFDWQTAYSGRKPRRRKYYKKRLRVFGNYHLLQGISDLLSKYCGCTEKTIQTMAISSKTCYISYCNQREIDNIIRTFNGNTPCFSPFWRHYDENE